ncbi:ABC transporter ATP-binding protein [Methylobacterium terricola]|uniref:ABC transporter ATP-binding protein n=1 Tax=Methylobacterium terricola TaxID=2583531 RepID=A0A5C4LHU9_9HYPH|nr:ABC transporter ATP-binding protein [Methylobacterium terricola]TNC11610.1 ABC transporter ATP-binding protein [Methylobacterium terricola]
MSLVAFRDVEKTYASRSGRPYTAIRGFDLDLAAGEFFCLLGTSGCGKTTVLNMLAGFEHPSGGTMTVRGRPVRGPGRDRGVVFQGNDSLYDWLTALENIALGPRLSGLPAAERRERANHYLSLVGLAQQGGKYPSELSGGMQQRIQIARALANDPDILLMDEPFGALDAQTRTTLQAELLRIWQATRNCVLFITHDIDEAVTLATRIGVMRAGPASTLKAVIDVDLAPEDRVRTSERFMAVYRRVHALLSDEVTLAALQAH